MDQRPSMYSPSGESAEGLSIDGPHPDPQGQDDQWHDFFEAPFEQYEESKDKHAIGKYFNAILYGIFFPFYISGKLGCCTLLFTLIPWSLCIFLPVIYMRTGPHADTAVTSAEAWGPLIFLFGTCHMASLSDDYVEKRVKLTEYLDDLKYYKITTIDGYSRGAEAVAADIRARARGTHFNFVFRCPFIILCLTVGLIHGLLPSILRAVQGVSAFGTETDGLTHWFGFTITIVNVVASVVFVGSFLFFGRYYSAGFQELEERWALFKKLTPSIWPTRDHDGIWVNNAMAWMKIRNFLKNDAADDAISAQLYFSFAVFILVGDWLYLVPRLVLNSYGLQELFIYRANLNTTLLVSSFATSFTVILVIFLVVSAFKANMMLQEQQNMLRSLRQHVILLMAVEAPDHNHNRYNGYVTKRQNYELYSRWLDAAISVLEKNESPLKIAGFNVDTAFVRTTVIVAVIGGLVAFFFLTTSSLTEDGVNTFPSLAGEMAGGIAGAVSDTVLPGREHPPETP